MGVLLLTQLTELMEAIHTSTHDDNSDIASETSDKITGKGLIPGHPTPPPSLNLVKI
jgi:hypothetical protein